MAKKILVEPQELRDTAAQLRHSSADIQHINAELRHAVMELDTGCWPSGDAARLTAHFSEAEVAGRRRVQARDDLSDTLMRAADAFERADTAAVQQLLGLVPTPRALPGSEPLHHTGLNARLPAAKNSVTKWNWRDALGDGLSWEADGFGWWAEAFERDHGRPPTAEDYAEFRLAWLLSGEGAVQWTDDDWVAFYYARLAGLETWLEKGDFPGPMSGQEVLAWVEACNALQQAAEFVGEPAPVVAPPGAVMYVTASGGLNMRTTPMIPEDDRDSNLAMDSKIPNGAQIHLNTHVPTLVTSGYEWGYVSYADADGKQHNGWVAIQYLREPRPLDSIAFSSSGYELIVRHEGIRLELYNDPSNNCTIGVGHLVHLGPIDGRESESEFLEGITEEEAYKLLDRDLADAQQTVRTLVTVPLTQNQYNALVSFAFNVGAGNFASSDLLEKLNQGDYESVPGELARWVHGSDGERQPGLVIRREEEGILFAADDPGEESGVADTLP